MKLVDAVVEERIYVIRGYKVMLDFHLAELYELDVKQLKRQVRRNLNRFPSDFMFVLSSKEYRDLRCQFGTLRWGAHSKYLPYVFTEHGVAMLSSVLNSRRAIQVNITIVRAFMKMREMWGTEKELMNRLMVLEHEITAHKKINKRHAEEIQAIFMAIQELIAAPKAGHRRIGFKA